MQRYITNTPNEYFEYANIVDKLIRSVQSNTKEYYLKAGFIRSAPRFLQYINFYLLNKGIAIYARYFNRITRASALNYEFARMREYTKDEDSEFFPHQLLFDAGMRETFNLKDVFSINIYSIDGQIVDCFENYIPKWASETGAQELLGVSLALKLTPKHRIRVYKCNSHIFLFTTKGMLNVAENDAVLYRKLWACLPLIRGWTEAPEMYDADLINLCKSLEPNDATNFWTMLTTLYNNTPALSDLKYKDILDTFNTLHLQRLSQQSHLKSVKQTEADSLMSRYSNILQEINNLNRIITELSETTNLDSDVIKLLFDKKTCYNLNIAHILDTDNSRISYRCSAPLLSYEKDAAIKLYDRRIKNDYSTDFKTIYKLMFIDEKVILNFDEEIVINFTRGGIQAKDGYLISGNNYDISFPNPHHAYYNCWGSYEPKIIKYIREYKLEELFYQIKAAVGSFNFTDYPVVNKLLQHLSYIIEADYNPACFYWVDEGCKTLHSLQETLEHFSETNEEVTE